MGIDKWILKKVKPFEKDERSCWIITTGIIGIIMNLLLSLSKIIIGVVSNSIAITSDAINNLSDAVSSIVTIIGTKMASKEPDKEHPYGHGRIEYISSLVISIFLFLVGWEFLKSSISTIRNPKDLKFSIVSILVLSLGILVKLWLGHYNNVIGKEHNAPALIATSKDAYGDVLISSVTLISTIVYLLFSINIDGYIGVLVAVFIIYSGIGLIKDTIDSLIGKKSDKELGNKIYAFVNKWPNVQGGYDLMLNNYGPNNHVGSMDITFLDTMSLADVSLELLKLQNAVYDEFDIYLVFGIYVKNTQDERVVKDEEKIRNIIIQHKEVKEVHAFYIIYDEKVIRLDVVVDFGTDECYFLDHIKDHISEEYPEYRIILNIDHRYI